MSEVLRLEDEGVLHPRRDEKDRRVYRETEVAAVAASRASAKRKITSGEIEASILDLLADGRTDVEIVRTMRVPFELVARVRAASRGETLKPIARVAPETIEELEKQREKLAARIAARRAARRAG